MMHRIKKENDMHEGKWNGLGGKFEPGETPEECVVREVFEETGLTIRSPQFKGRIAFWDLVPESKNRMHVYIFLADQFSGELKESEEGFLQWISNEQLLDLNLWAGDRIFLPWLDQDRIFSAKFIYNNGDFLDHQVVFY
jgi:8-oxo-dGTP diphosphatase